MLCYVVKITSNEKAGLKPKKTRHSISQYLEHILSYVLESMCDDNPVLEHYGSIQSLVINDNDNWSDNNCHDLIC